MQVRVEPFFDSATWTVTYVVYEEGGSHCAVVDPVLDFDPKSGRIRRDAVGRVVEFIRAHALRLQWVLETHAHADHLSAAAYLKQELGGRTAIGAEITQVQQVFKSLFNLEAAFATDGSQFDRLLHDGETFSIGALPAQVMHVPGHTPACVAYLKIPLNAR